MSLPGSNTEDGVQQVTNSLHAASLKDDVTKSSKPASTKDPAPSTMSDSKFMETVGNDRIAFNRFSTAKAVLPLTLACQMFAQFTEHQKSVSEPGLIHMKFANEFERVVKGLPYQLEQQRTNELLILLHDHYGVFFSGKGLFMNCISVPGGFSTDISIFEKYDAQIYINFEMKRKVTTKVNPLLQNATYFLYTKSICSYLITITDDGIQICGALLLPVTGRMQAVVDYLTPLYEYHDTKRIAKAFESIIMSLEELKLMRATPFYSILAALPKLNAYNYCNRLFDTKLVFLADGPVSSETKRCIVKFVEEEYGDNVHRYLFERGLAPELYNVVSVRGSWKAITMEFLQGTSLCDISLDTEEKTIKIISCLENIKTTLQGSPYVHGDLRPSNMIVTSDYNVKIVDFDWAGEDSKVFYPPNLNTDIAWASGVKPGKPITKKHDTWMLNCEIKRFQNMLSAAN